MMSGTILGDAKPIEVRELDDLVDAAALHHRGELRCHVAGGARSFLSGTTRVRVLTACANEASFAGGRPCRRAVMDKATSAGVSPSTDARC